MRLRIAGVALAIGLSFSAVTQAGGVSGSAIANTCAGCHGVNGASSGDTMPIIGGLPKVFLDAAMKQYRDGTRASTIMGRIAKGYNDEQIAAMSEILAKQQWVSSKETTDAKLAQIGREIHVKRCEVCHEKEGSLVAADAPPRVAGQWMGYLNLYLNDINNPDWANKHPKKQLFATLSKDEMNALAHFFASKK